MTHETPHTPSGDDDAFDALMRINWDVSPSLPDDTDPGIKRVLEVARTAEEALNEHDDLSESLIKDVLQKLNDEWEHLKVPEDTLSVTGKLRPSEYALEQDILDNVEEGVFEGLDTHQSDLLGDYIIANEFEVTIHGFDAEEMEFGEGATSYRIVLNCGLTEDYADDEVWFKAYPDELENVEPYQPTHEGTAAFIEQYFPDVFAAIQSLPEDCRDPELIRESLDNLVVTMSPEANGSPVDFYEALDIIERYIAERLNFDDATYDASVDGVIYGRRMNYEKVRQEWHQPLRELLIRGVRLIEVESDPSTNESTYRLALQTWYLTPGIGEGRTPIYIPIDSLTKLVSNRPQLDEYPFAGEMELDAAEGLDDNSSMQLLGSHALVALEMSDDEDEYEDEYDDDAEYDDYRDDNNAFDDQYEDEEISAVEYHRRFLEELSMLHEFLRQYVSSTTEHPYEDEAEVESITQLVHDRIVAFMERWSANVQTVIEVTGEGIRFPHATFTKVVDEKGGHRSLSIDHQGVQKADSFANAKGVLLQPYTRQDIDDDGMYYVRAYFEFGDVKIASRVTPINDPDLNIPLISLSSNRSFLVDLGLPVEYSLPELDYAEKRAAAFNDVQALRLPPRRHAKVIQVLDQLAEAIDNEDAKIMMKYQPLEELQYITRSVDNNPQALNVVADTMEAILGRDRMLVCVGPCRTMDGELLDTTRVTGKLEAVLTTHPTLPKSEIALLMTVAAQSSDEADVQYLFPFNNLLELKF